MRLQLCTTQINFLPHFAFPLPSSKYLSPFREVSNYLVNRCVLQFSIHSLEDL